MQVRNSQSQALQTIQLSFRGLRVIGGYIARETNVPLGDLEGATHDSVLEMCSTRRQATSPLKRPDNEIACDWEFSMF